MTKAEIKTRAKLIRNATPDLLEACYKNQRRLCDLCGEGIQDLILAALDHSIPVIWIAKSDLPIEEAIALANAPMNLKAVHCRCNHVKLGKSRKLWFSLGLDKAVGRPHTYTDVELLELEFRVGIGPRAGGRSNAKNKTGFCGRTPEKMSEDGRKAGLIQGPIRGRQIVESGEWDRIRNLPQTKEAQRKNGRTQGRKNFKNKTGLFGRTLKQRTEDSRRGGLKSGCEAAERGQIQALQDLPQTRAAARRNGRNNVENGHLQKISSQAGRMSNHLHWHVNGYSRSGKFYLPKPSAKCALCIAAGLIKAAA
jgi:hypothetical protein